MTEENYKSEAKCRYHGECTLYNNSVLPLEIEVAMCGKGQQLDERYKPYVPEPAEFMPSEDYPHPKSGGICDAYMRHKDSELISAIVKYLYVIKNRIDKHGYW